MDLLDFNITGIISLFSYGTKCNYTLVHRLGLFWVNLLLTRHLYHRWFWRFDNYRLQLEVCNQYFHVLQVRIEPLMYPLLTSFMNSLAWVGVIIGTVTEALRETGGNKIDNSSVVKSRTMTLATETLFESRSESDFVPDIVVECNNENALWPVNWILANPVHYKLWKLWLAWNTNIFLRKSR